MTPLHRWTAALTLLVLCAVGFWTMSTLQSRADRTREWACLHNPASAEWTHGYGAWLPLSVLTTAVLAAALAITVLFSQAPKWTMILSYPIAVAAALALFPAALSIDTYFSFPGSDISTRYSPPCGVAHPQ